MYNHIHRGQNLPRWKGIRVLKFGTDLLLYHQVINDNKPDVLVEIGTKHGGSALFFADQGVKVITIDIKDFVKHKDPRITYIRGSSLDADVMAQVKALIGPDDKVMVVVDGNHMRRHVKWELFHYGKIVTPGQYMVVEDCYIDRGLYGPGEARDWYLNTRRKQWEQTNLCNQFLGVGITRGGWLRKR
jgi:cephalosporin hydroxylase